MSETLAIHGQQKSESGSIPPVCYALTTSAENLSLNGEPRFTITISATCSSDRPIWAFIFLSSWWNYGLRISEPACDRYKVGPAGPGCIDEWDSDELEREDSKVVRLAKNETFELEYVITTSEEDDAEVPSDIADMREGGEYLIQLDERHWRWMYEDEMPPLLTAEERRDLLYRQPAIEWQVDCQVVIKAVR